MLSLRLAIVVSLSAVALWGLFSLLANLRAPELLRSSRAIVVKGCDPVDSEDAQSMCPQLFCQKALLDARIFQLRTDFETTIDRRAGGRRLIGGAAQTESGARGFACVLAGGKVVSARALDASQLAALAAQDGGWETAP